MKSFLLVLVGSVLVLGCGDDADGGSAGTITDSVACAYTLSFDVDGTATEAQFCVASSCTGPAASCERPADASCEGLAAQFTAAPEVTLVESKETDACTGINHGASDFQTDDGAGTVTLTCYHPEGDALGMGICDAATE